MKKSIIDVKVSCFENCLSTIPKEISLLNWIQSNKYRAKVENLRSIQDEDLQKIIKASLPAITPSGLFSYRDTDHLIEHSGFLAFDIDKKDNKNISFNGLKEQISHIKSVAYCGLSVRGQGFWGLVPIPKSTPEEHKQRFSALLKDFKIFDINIDPSGSDICRLRIYSWDPDAYFNHNAECYVKILKPQPKNATRPALNDTRERVETIISQIKAGKIDITQDYKEGWLKIAASLANEFGESGRGYFHSISQFHAKYDANKTDAMFDNVLKHDYKITIGSFFKIASDYGIKLKPDNIESSRRREELSFNHHAEVVPLPPQVTDEHSDDPVTTLPKIKKIVKSGPWSNEIEELEKFFASIKLPEDPIKLNQCSTITDINLFIKSNFDTIRAQNGNTRFIPYLDLLNELKAILKANVN